MIDMANASDWSDLETRDIHTLAAASLERWPDAWVALVERGIRAEPGARHRFLMKLVSAAESMFWGWMRFAAGTPGANNDGETCSPEKWHVMAYFETIDTVRALLALTDLTAFEAETVMGHVQYTIDALTDRDSRPPVVVLVEG